MIEVVIDAPYQRVSDACHLYVSKRRYYLHNRCGGTEWEVRTNGGKTIAKFADAAMATFIILKLTK